MGIYVGSNEVITNDRELSNITGASGNYDGFHPNATALNASGATTISMNKAFYDVTLTAGATLNATDLVGGHTTVVAMDTSASGHTPVFSSNVKWPDDSQPVWGDHRYWNVALVAWDASVVRAAATGYDA